jgi:hypothetical protein
VILGRRRAARGMREEEMTDNRLAAFGMVIVLGSYVYTSIKSARRNAEDGREKMLSEVLESRRKLGMDGLGGFRRKAKEDNEGVK